MDGLQLTVIGKAVSDWRWQDDPARVKRRVPVGENLDASVDSGRTWFAVKSVVAAFASAVRARWTSAARRHRVASTPLPSAEATSQG